MRPEKWNNFQWINAIILIIIMLIGLIIVIDGLIQLINIIKQSPN